MSAATKETERMKADLAIEWAPDLSGPVNVPGKAAEYQAAATVRVNGKTQLLHTSVTGESMDGAKHAARMRLLEIVLRLYENSEGRE
jgi:hypothetical protein